MAIGRLLELAAGCSGTAHLQKVRDMGYLTPCKTVFPLSESAELLTSANMGSYDNPVVTVGVEAVKGEDFTNIIVLVPDMDILVNTGMSEDDVTYYMQKIATNLSAIFAIADGEV